MPEIQEASLVDEDACEALQKEEREVLQVGYPAFLVLHSRVLKRAKSIFPDFLLSGWGITERRIELEVPVELPEDPPRKVVIIPPDEQSQQDHSHPIHNLQFPFSLTTLPPITLVLTLPLDYPLHRPPIISGLRSSYGWLPAEKLKLLERALQSVWEVEREQGGGEGRAILYDWVEMIRSAEAFLGKLGMVTDDSIL